RSTGGDASTTAFMVGTRIHYGPVQLVGHLNPATLLNGTWLLSGVQSPLWAWVSLIYDWDYDADTESGSGTVHYSPHAAEPGSRAPAAAPVEPAPPPVEEEFES
ncbi:MAG: hypothetical protein V3T05_12315, partial [Myxococcota bacterium]